MAKVGSVWRVVTVVCLLAGAVAEGVVYVPVTDASLVDRSPIAVVATVLSFDSTGVSETAYRVSVERLLKGSVSAPEIVVMVPGSDTFVAPGMPRLVPGERWIFFLAQQPTSRYRLVELMLGAFREVRVEDSPETRAIRELTGTMAIGRAATEPSRDFAAFAESSPRAISPPSPNGSKAARRVLETRVPTNDRRRPCSPNPSGSNPRLTPSLGPLRPAGLSSTREPPFPGCLDQGAAHSPPGAPRPSRPRSMPSTTSRTAIWPSPTRAQIRALLAWAPRTAFTRCS